MKQKITIYTIIFSTLLFCACSNEKNTTQNNTNQSTQQTQISQTTKTTTISEEDAKLIALEHAGLDMNQINYIKSTLDQYDLIKHYDVEFYTSDQKEYDYEIAVDTGEILEWDMELVYE